jgi:predicted  nucleic acid-binding Zn-ribbon protein
MMTRQGRCPECGTRIRTLDDEWLCCPCCGWSELEPVIPDDGYADGGRPYTDEELEIINGTA